MRNLRNETACIHSLTRLYDQVIRQVALHIKAYREGVFLCQLGIHLGRPQYFCRRRTGGLCLSEGRCYCRHALLDLLQARKPEQTVLDERPSRREAIFVLVERSAPTTLDRRLRTSRIEIACRAPSR